MAKLKLPASLNLSFPPIRSSQSTDRAHILISFLSIIFCSTLSHAVICTIGKRFLTRDVLFPECLTVLQWGQAVKLYSLWKFISDQYLCTLTDFFQRSMKQGIVETRLQYEKSKQPSPCWVVSLICQNCLTPIMSMPTHHCSPHCTLLPWVLACRRRAQWTSLTLVLLILTWALVITFQPGLTTACSFFQFNSELNYIFSSLIVEDHWTQALRRYLRKCVSHRLGSLLQYWTLVRTEGVLAIVIEYPAGWVVFQFQSVCKVDHIF